jgi:hypothetical protein
MRNPKTVMVPLTSSWEGIASHSTLQTAPLQSPVISFVMDSTMIVGNPPSMDLVQLKSALTVDWRTSIEHGIIHFKPLIHAN